MLLPLRTPERQRAGSNVKSTEFVVERCCFTFRAAAPGPGYGESARAGDKEKSLEFSAGGGISRCVVPEDDVISDSPRFFTFPVSGVHSWNSSFVISRVELVKRNLRPVSIWAIFSLRPGPESVRPAMSGSVSPGHATGRAPFPLSSPRPGKRRPGPLGRTFQPEPARA